MTEDEEAEADARAAEQEWDDWLASWIEDFWSDEYAASIVQPETFK